ncbi:MAG: hypothetical protein KGI58_02075 [Patescibacteria group bacterium]|nr:hypothetical protein [Patescibacteria group bacterium]
MEQDLIKIINISIYAPSGDNSQPWNFKIKNNSIFVYNISERDRSLYNFNNNAALIAIGGLLTNIRIAASHFNYTVEIKIINNNNLVAECNFKKDNINEDELFLYIKTRQTNRKPYKQKTPDKNIFKQLLIANIYEHLKIEIVTESNLITRIADACSVNEQIVLENKKLHDFLFNHITWTNKEDMIKKGFYIKTLELNGPQAVVFKLLKSWRINSFFNKIGISKFIAKENAKLYSESGAMIAITSNIIDNKIFIETGMLMQRLWLIATKHELYMQPLTGITFLKNTINSSDGIKEFNSEHLKLIESSYKKIKNIFNNNDEHINFIFRVGYAEKPTAGTRRLNAEIATG